MVEVKNVNDIYAFEFTLMKDYSPKRQYTFFTSTMV